MSYKPDEKDWMAYLYGELEEAERLQFERYVSTNPGAERRLEQYRELRAMLARAEDKEVITPPTFGLPSGQLPQVQRFWHTQYFKTITTLAASLLIVILVGKLTGAQLTVSSRAFVLSFGPTPEEPRQETPAAAALSTERVQEMIDASVGKNNVAVKEQLGETQKALEASLRSVLTKNSGQTDQLVREAASASQQQIREYVEAIREENMRQVKEYFQLTSTEQKQYIENLLVDFSKYLQQQRNNDLQLVQTRMNSIEQNSDLFRQETEQILTSIITTVGNPPSGEIKN